MYRYKRLLVGLDLTEMDVKIIKYVDYLCGVMSVDKVYFMHVAKTFELPSGVREKYPDLIAPVDETISREINNLVSENFTAEVDFHIEVKQGNPADQILKWSNFKEIDLVIMGRKRVLRGGGVLPGKMVKMSHCSLLFITEDANLPIKKIMLPVDFSKQGKMALEVAARLHKKIDCNILFHHSFQVPTGYHTSGKSFQEFANVMRGHAQNDMNEFIGQVDFNSAEAQINLFLDEDNDPGKHISEVAEVEGADLLVISSKGRSAIASMIIGSVAEKVCHLENKIPVLVVKDKHQNMGFLDAILKL